jgi:hypothetical protein
MSADKDRGIRRQKQKRAKQSRKAARQSRSPVPVQTTEPAAKAAD